ncbi:MAG: hypothetical protein ACR2J6_01420 [Thermoleophilaceae bacterium]
MSNRYVSDQDGGDVNVNCPADAPRRCHGRVELRRRGHLLAGGRFSVLRGRVGFARLRTTRSGRRLVLGGEDLAIVVRVVSRDRRGVKRTVSARGFFMVFNDPFETDGPADP